LKKGFDRDIAWRRARLTLQHVADIYNWFIEAFDTADLKDAKALLDEPARQNAGCPYQ